MIPDSKLLSKWSALVVVLIYLAITVLITWPVAFHLRSLIFAQPGDPFGALFSLWQSRDVWPSFTFPAAPFLVITTTLLARVFDEVVSFNLIQLSGFVLTGVAGYLFARRLHVSHWAAFLTGLLLLVTPFHTSHALQHLGLANLQWLVFFLVSLLWFDERPTVGRGALAGILFAITTLDSYLYGLFALMILVVFGTWKLYVTIGSAFAHNQWPVTSGQLPASGLNPSGSVVRRSSTDNWLTRWSLVTGHWRLPLAGFLVGTLIALILILPAVWPLIAPTVSDQPISSQNLTPNRSLDEASAYSAQWFAYSLPVPDNPLFGRWTADRYETSLTTTGSNLTELSLYPGWITIVLAVSAVVITIVEKWPVANGRLPMQESRRAGRFHRWKLVTGNWSLTSRQQRIAWFLVLLTLVGLWLSFAPTVPLGPWQLPTLAPQLTEWFPFLRVFSRFGLLTTIGSAGLAAIGFDRVLTWLPTPRSRTLIVGVVLILSIAELLVWPAQRTVAVGPAALPAVYRQIPAGSRIAEYPLLPTDEPAGEIYLLWNRLTGESLLNADPTKTAGNLVALHDPRRTETIDRLIADRVQFITVHRELYTPALIAKQPATTTHGMIPALTDPRAHFLGTFDTIDLYRLTPAD